MVDAIIRGTVERGPRRDTVERGPRRDPAAAKALPIGMRIMWRVVGGAILKKMGKKCH